MASFHVKNPLLDMLRFKNATKKRDKIIQNAPEDPLPPDYPTNVQEKALHPVRQEALIRDIRPSGDGKIYVLHTPDERPLAYFRAGMAISILFHLDGVTTTRCYSLSSSPERALHGTYEIAVKKNEGGFIAPYILKNWQIGTRVVMSAPEGVFYYEKLRDEPHLVALAGGCGITPFVSMARALEDGSEDFDLTILYGVKSLKEALYKKELDDLAKNCPKVHVVYVLSEEKKDGYEHGFLSGEIIKKYSPQGSVSYFACGPQILYGYLEQQMALLGIDQKHYKEEIFGVPKDVCQMANFPHLSFDKKFRIKVHYKGEVWAIEGLAKEPLLIALERAGFKVPSLCRGGLCGFCRSRLLKGEVYVPWRCDGRKKADASHHLIHPCVSYPMSDVEIEVQPSSLY
jgi:ferredoxin-NADP reductase/ferredoxin